MATNLANSKLLLNTWFNSLARKIRSNAHFILNLACRSHNGCWTCRLRRKKCDEHRPACSICSSLELDCHGYGPKPGWMDGGVLEREQAHKFKHILAQTKSNRRRERLLCSPPHLESQGDSQLAREACYSLSSPTQGTVVIAVDSVHPDILQICSSETDLLISNESMWSESLFNSILPAELSFNHRDDVSASNQGLFIENAEIGNNSASAEPSKRAYAPTSISRDAYIAHARRNNDIHGGGAQFEADMAALVNFCQPTSCHDSYLSIESTSDVQVGLSAQINSSSTSRTLANHVPLPMVSNQSILCGHNEDDALFMYYLDQVFYVQYPFYHSSYERGWVWFFSILRQAKSTYYAALALSEYYQHSTQHLGHNSMSSHHNHLRAKGRHYDLALQEMELNLAQSHTWNGTLGLTRNVETLTCILQLLFCEVHLPLLCFVFNTNNLRNSCLMVVEKTGRCISPQRLP
jgi:hypothetical protein